MFHDGCWSFKFLAVFLAFSGSLFIPNSFFQGYMDFARFVSEGFLLAQALLMLVTAYKINECLIRNYEQEAGGLSGAVVVALTLLLTGGNITWIIFQYKWYSGCGGNVALMTVTAAFVAGFYVIVLFRTREDASILTSSIVATYVLYLQWSALASNAAECNPFLHSSVNTTMQIVAGLGFTLLSLLIIAGSTKKEEKATLSERVNGPLMEAEGAPVA